MKYYQVKDNEAVRYFVKPGKCSAELYETLTRIIAKTGALIVSEEMLLQYIQQKKGGLNG